MAGRTWALMDLDAGLQYRLWFDQEKRRWEVERLGSGDGALVTRPWVEERRRGRLPGARAAAGAAAPDNGG